MWCSGKVCAQNRTDHHYQKVVRATHGYNWRLEVLTGLRALIVIVVAIRCLVGDAVKRTGIVAMLAGLLLMASSQVSAAVHGANIAWFRTRTQALYDAVAPGHTGIWNRTLAKDCIITDEDGHVYDKTEFLKALKPLPAGFTGHIKVEHLSVRGAGNAAVVHYWLDERENVFGQRLTTAYIETDTYRRLGATWRMVAAQDTVVPRDLQPVKTSTSNWSSLVGTYYLGPDGNGGYEVFARGGKLYGGSSKKAATLLIPLSPLVFFQQRSIHIMVFVTGAHGAVNEVLELHKYNEVTLRRAPKVGAK